MRLLRQGHHRKIPPEGAGSILARRLLKMWMLRRSTRRGRIYAVHKGRPHPMQKGLSKVQFKCLVNSIEIKNMTKLIIFDSKQVIWRDGKLRGMQQSDTCLRNGDESQELRLPSGVLRLPTV